MADTDISRQAKHMPGAKDIPHQTIALALLQTVRAPGHDAGRILAAMLENGERIVNRLIDGTLRNDTDNAAHQSATPKPTMRAAGSESTTESGTSMS